MRSRLIVTLVALAALVVPSLVASYTPGQEYPISFSMGDVNGVNPADGAVHYFGMQAGNDSTTSVDGGYHVLAPVTGTVVKAYGNFPVTGTLGSAQNVTITVRDVTANSTQDITTAAQWTAASNPVSNTAMTLAVTAGDLLLIKWTSPTWTPTNPTQVFGHMTLVVRASS